MTRLNQPTDPRTTHISSLPSGGDPDRRDVAGTSLSSEEAKGEDLSSSAPLRVPPPPAVPEGDKSFVVTVLLSYLLGVFGADRFYLGKIGTGLLKLITFGGYGVWWLIDLLITLFGGQRDAAGLRLAGYDKYKSTIWVVVGVIFALPIFITVLAAIISVTFDRAGPAVGWVLVTVLAAGAVVGGVSWFRGRRRGFTGQARTAGAAYQPPAHIRTRVEKLLGLQQLYVERASAGDHVASTVVGQVDSLVANVTELFRRLRLKAEKAQRGLAQAEYEDKLDKLAAALDQDYLLDVLANPRLWDNPERRIRDVQAAIEAVDDQVLENIKQVNARRGLVFQLPLDGLLGPRKALADWQSDFESASGAD